MQSTFLKTSIKRAIKMWAAIMFAAVASFAQSHDVYLAAQKYTKTLPGGATAQSAILRLPPALRLRLKPLDLQLRSVLPARRLMFRWPRPAWLSTSKTV